MHRNEDGSMNNIEKLFELLSVYYQEQPNDFYSPIQIAINENNIERKIEIVEECIEDNVMIHNHPEYYVMYDLQENDVW
jgi:hypothetical protein